MEKESFRLYVAEVERYNDSLDKIKGNRLPHKPSPEGVLRRLIRECIEKGTCPDE